MSLYLDLLRSVRVVEALPPSHCTCPLEEGTWGMGGWHYARYTRETLERKFKFLFAKEHDGKDQRELRFLWDVWKREEELAGRFEDGVHVTWKPYLQLPYAYEPCPAYRASVSRELAKEKTKKTAETPYA